MNPHPYTAAVVGVGKKDNSHGAKGGGHQIGYTHARTLQAHPRIRLAAGVDISRENLEAFLERHGLPAAAGFSSLEAMLETVRPDIVSLCTYVGLHEPMIQACARAGVKGILCEKPFVHSIPALERVEELVKRTGIKIAVAHIRRYLPVFRDVRRLIDQGAIGHLQHVYAGIGGWDLSEWGSHWLDIFRYLNHDQPVLHVFGQGRVRTLRGYGHAMEDHAIAHFEFANGCRATLDGGRGIQPAAPDARAATMTLAGTDGMIQILGGLSEIRLLNAAGESRTVVDQECEANTWPPFVEDMVRWLDGGTESETGFSTMRGSAELNLAVYLSMVRGDRIDLPVRDANDEWPVEALAARQAGKE